MEMPNKALKKGLLLGTLKISSPLTEIPVSRHTDFAHSNSGPVVKVISSLMPRIENCIPLCVRLLHVSHNVSWQPVAFLTISLHEKLNLKKNWNKSS